MKHIRSVLATLLAALSIAVMAAPATAACPPDLAGRLRLHGSNTIGAELAPALAAAFAACEGLTDQSVNQLSDPDEREFIFGGGDSERKLMFEDFAHGSSTAPPDLAAQPAKADIGMMSRLPTDAEIAELVGAGRGRPLPPPQTDPNAPPSDAGYEHVIALDGIAVRNPGLIAKFGGHAMAAGVTLARDRLGLAVDPGGGAVGSPPAARRIGRLGDRTAVRPVGHDGRGASLDFHGALIG